MYSRFKVPPEMAQELATLMEMAKKVEVDSEGNIRKDSQYNSDIYRDLGNWMDRAVQAGVQMRNLNISDWTEFLKNRNLGFRSKGRVSKKTKDKIKVLKKGLQDFEQPDKGKKRKAQDELENKKAKIPKRSLEINTNVKRVQGPKAPTRTDFPELNKSDVSTANIIGGSRRGRKV